MNDLSPYSTPKMMSKEEARKRVITINAGMNNVRALLLDFYEREGWKALNYTSWRECVTAEFGQSQAYLYRQLEAAQIEERISQASVEAGGKSFSPIGEKSEIPESQLRPLAQVPPEDQPTVYQLAKETAPGKLTAAHVEKTVREIRGEETVSTRTVDCQGCPDHRGMINKYPGVKVPGNSGKCIREGGPCEKAQENAPVPQDHPAPSLPDAGDGVNTGVPYFTDLAIRAIDKIKDTDPGCKEALAKIAVHIWNRQRSLRSKSAFSSASLAAP